MSITILAVGRLKKGPLKLLCDEYLDRFDPPGAVVEVEERRPLSGPELRRREGALLLGKTPKNALLVALDAGGREYTSETLAEQIEDWRARSGGEVVFAIGGADGLDDAVLRRADAVLSLGRLTWPHMIARLLLLEQLYRAQAIRTGHPYHRG